MHAEGLKAWELEFAINNEMAGLCARAQISVTVLKYIDHQPR
jgi:hypothetical protein